jgi:hypothetical protein
MEIACQAALKRLACYVIIREDHIWQEELEMATGAKILVVDNKETVFSRKSTAVDEVISKPFTLAEIDETIQNLSGKALCA